MPGRGRSVLYQEPAAHLRLGSPVLRVTFRTQLQDCELGVEIVEVLGLGIDLHAEHLRILCEVFHRERGREALKPITRKC
jgi:hypothetical protein